MNKKLNKQIKKLKDVHDLLSPAERVVLFGDLAKMAKQRQRAEAESAHIQMH